jgi:hypothetical protein
VAAKSFYFTSVSASGTSTAGSMSETAPGSASTNEAQWTVGKTAGGRYSPMNYNATQGTGTFGTTALPDGTAPTVTKCFRSENPYTGTFAAGQWTLNVLLQATGANVAGVSCTARIWRSTSSSTPSGGTEIGPTGPGTFDYLQGSTAIMSNGNTARSTSDSSTKNRASATLSNEYVWVELALMINSQSSSNSSAVILLSEPNGTNVTLTTSDFTQPTTLTAAQGSYALTRNAATLTVQRKVAADTKSLAVTANATGLVHNYPLTAATKSLAVTANATGLTVQRKITAATASYVETASATNLAHGFKLVADTRSYAETANATGVTVQRKLSASTAAFAETGNATGLTATRRITADASSCAVTGTSTALAHGYKVAAAVAMFAGTGSATALTAQRKIPAASRTFVHTANSANLTRSAKVTADVRGLSLSAPSTGVTAQRLKLAAAASIALVGNPVGFDVGMPASTASYVLTRNDATLTYEPSSGNAYDLHATTASFAVVGSDTGTTAQRRLSATAAALLFESVATAVLAHRTVPAGSGGISLGLADAEAISGRRLVASATTVSLVGFGTTFVRGTIAFGETRTIAFVGVDAYLVWSSAALPLPGRRTFVIEQAAREADASSSSRAMTVEQSVRKVDVA